jgi:hypothetical protein
VDAETRLIETLGARAPDLLNELQFDTESSAVWLVSRRRAALEEVRELVNELDVDDSADLR